MSKYSSAPSGRELSLYGLAGGGQVFGYSLIVGYLSYYSINVLLIDPKTVGLLLLVQGLWDVVNNPLAGLQLDRRRGKEKAPPVLRKCTVPLSVCTALLFSGAYLLRGISAGTDAKVWYLAVVWFLWEILYTITDVAFWSLSATVSGAQADRLAAQKRVAFFQTIGGSFPALLVPLGLDGCHAGWLPVSLPGLFFGLGVLSAAGVGLLLLAGVFVKERIPPLQAKQPTRSEMRAVFQNPPLLSLLAANLLNTIQGVGSSMTTYYFSDVLGSASLSIVTGAAAAICWLFSYRVTDRMRKVWSGRQILLRIPLLLGTVWLLLAAVGYPIYNNRLLMVLLLSLLQGAGGLFSTAYSVIFNEQMAQATDFSEWKYGVRMEALSFSAKITTQKTGNTLSQAVAARLLSWLGYRKPVGGRQQVQTPLASKGIFLIYMLSPAFGFLLSCIPLLFGRLTAEEEQKMQDELKTRRKTRGAAEETQPGLL